MASNATSPAATALPPNSNESKQVSIYVCAVITWVAAAIFVAARFYTRWILVRVLSWEDWAILVALVFAALNNAGMIEQATYGLGKHVWTIPLEILPRFQMAGWYTILWYALSLWATKVSIMLLYLRILTYPWAKKATYILLVIVTLCNLEIMISVLTACVPIQGFWDTTVKAVCHTQDWYWANTGMHMITDFLIYLLPTPVIFTMRVPQKQKLLLYFIFAFGFFLCLVSIVRLTYLLDQANHPDFSYDNIPIVYWTCVEVNFAIICACMMTFKPLIAKLIPRLVDQRPLSSDPEHRATHSIGGRALTTAAAGTQAPRPSAKMTQEGSSTSWVVVSSRLGSDAPILEEDEDEHGAGFTLRDIEAQTVEKKADVEVSNEAQLRSKSASSSGDSIVTSSA